MKNQLLTLLLLSLISQNCSTKQPTHLEGAGQASQSTLPLTTVSHSPPTTEAIDDSENETSATLTVNKTGIGRVTSNSSGIVCGDQCTATFPKNTLVELIGLPPNPQFFILWSGCDSVIDSVCKITLGTSRVIAAQFKSTYLIDDFSERRSEVIAGSVLPSGEGQTSGGKYQYVISGSRSVFLRHDQSQAQPQKVSFTSNPSSIAFIYSGVGTATFTLSYNTGFTAIFGVGSGIALRNYHSDSPVTFNVTFKSSLGTEHQANYKTSLPASVDPAVRDISFLFSSFSNIETVDMNNIRYLNISLETPANSTVSWSKTELIPRE